MKISVCGKTVETYSLPCVEYLVYESDSDVINISICDEFEVKSIRPLKLNLSAANDFSVNTGSKVIIEFENHNPLFIFTYKKQCVNKDEFTYFFDEGEFTLDEIKLKSGEKLYVGAKAVLHAHISAQDAENIEVCGPGVIDITGISTKKRRMAKFLSCKNVTVKDTTFVGAIDWTIVPINCDNVTIDGANIITWEVNGDGIDPVGSKNVYIKNCFLHCADDCISVKATDYDHQEGCTDCDNIQVSGCIMWNTKPGNAMEIGFETRCDNITNVSFVDCDVLHCVYEGWQSGGVFTIHNGDRAVVSNVLYKNIRVENAEQKLFDFKVYKSHYSKDEERGFIKNIVAEDIYYFGEELPPSILRGCDNQHGVKNMVIRGLYHNDKRLDNVLKARFIAESGSELTFE
ncbi:MAG: hypothetical protein IJF54_00095 [Clostridia bacterium]|nr:hypothetical protein [Clostridia bacterium]